MWLHSGYGAEVLRQQMRVGLELSQSSGPVAGDELLMKFSEASRLRYTANIQADICLSVCDVNLVSRKDL